jgi:transcriptional regulator with XRE-family HTH domain
MNMTNAGSLSSAGHELRRLRLQRGLTLEQAAASLGMSIPMLSRKERGEQSLKREDIRACIERFRLQTWEAYHLWLSAGFLPEFGWSSARPINAGHLADTALRDCAFPACLLSRPGYLVAWNQPFETIAQPSRLSVAPLHVLDLLLGAAPEPALAVAWEHTILQAARTLYPWALGVLHEPPFQQLITLLSRRYGAAFDRRWYNFHFGQGAQIPPAHPSEPIIPISSAYGVVRFVTLRGALAVPGDYGLLMLVPLGQESTQRYQQMQAAMGGSKLYFPPP